MREPFQHLLDVPQIRELLVKDSRKAWKPGQAVPGNARGLVVGRCYPAIFVVVARRRGASF